MKRSAIVTGGGQGIGKGIVLDLLRREYRVAIFEADAEAGRETVSEYSRIGEVHVFEADTSNEDDVGEAVDATIKAFGRLDLLVNNAGIADPSGPPADELTLEAWNRIIGVNLTGYFLCAKHAARALGAAKGAIVNISSTRAWQSEPNTLAYAASKGGVVALTHALAISLGPEVRVNCISPGWIDVSEWKKASSRKPADLRPIDHHQHPAGRVGHPGDIASLVSFLASDEAGFITGQDFIVDGGMTRKMIYAE